MKNKKKDLGYALPRNRNNIYVFDSGGNLLSPKTIGFEAPSVQRPQLDLLNKDLQNYVQTMNSNSGATSMLGSAGNILGGATNLAGSIMGNLSVPKVDQTNNRYDSTSDAYNALRNYDKTEFEKNNLGTSTISGLASGAGIGTAIAPGIGTAIGAAVGGLGSLFSGIFGNKKRKRAENKLDYSNRMNLISGAQSQSQDDYLQRLSMSFAEGGGIHIKPENRGKFNATKERTGKTTEELTHSKNPVTRKRAIFAQNAAKWHHADGGYLSDETVLDPRYPIPTSVFAYGGDFDNGVEVFDGYSHEDSMYGGIPQGMNESGQPNLVEDGEVKYNDYIYSNRLKIDPLMVDLFNLNKSYKGKTYAQAMKNAQRESAERPYDPISKAGLSDSASKLEMAQEAFKMLQEQSNIFAYGGSLKRRLSMAETPARKELIPGGKADTKFRHNSNKDVDPTELAMGISVEMEHTDSRKKSREIALDHLKETPDYYTRLYGIGLADEPITKEEVQMVEQNLMSEGPAQWGFKPEIQEIADQLAYGGRMERAEYYTADDLYREGLFANGGGKKGYNPSPRLGKSVLSMFQDYNKKTNQKFIERYGNTPGVRVLNPKISTNPNAIYDPRVFMNMNIDTPVEYRNENISGYDSLGQPIISTKSSEVIESTRPTGSTNKKKKPEDFQRETLERITPEVKRYVTQQPNLRTLQDPGKYIQGIDPLEADSISKATVNALRQKEREQQSSRTGIDESVLRYASPFVNVGLGMEALLSSPEEMMAEQINPNLIGNYMDYDPIDREYLANQLRAQAGATRRGVLNTSGANRGAAMAGLLASDYNAQRGLSGAYMDVDEANMNRLVRAKEFNRATDMFNAQAQTQAQTFNAQSRMQVNDINMRNRAARRTAIRNAVTALGSDLSGIGQERFNRNTVKSLPFLYDIDASGNVKFKR